MMAACQPLQQQRQGSAHAWRSRNLLDAQLQLQQRLLLQQQPAGTML
jgi:hypothetical protein